MASENAARAPARIIDMPMEPAAVSDGVAIVDETFRPVALDRGAEAIFDALRGRSRTNGEVEVPQPILDFLRSRFGQYDHGSPMSVNAGGHHYTCRAFVLQPRNGAKPFLTLYLRREVSLVEAVHQIAVDYRLTDREEEAIMGLALGLSSKELATRMGISPNTVKAFVRLAMIKMGASSRARLVAKLLDRQTG